jgi:hypothetical protein
MPFGSSINQYLPQAAIGNGNYVYVASGSVIGGNWTQTGINNFGIEGLTEIDTDGALHYFPALTVMQAYNIDKKLDDGVPVTGRVLAVLVSTTSMYMDDFNVGYSPTTCYYGNSTYTTMSNNGAGVYCTLMFQFQ